MSPRKRRQPPAAVAEPKRSPLGAVLVVVLSTAAVVALAVASTYIWIPTAIALTATATRVGFTIAAGDTGGEDLFTSAAAISYLGIERCQSVTFVAARIERADGGATDPALPKARGLVQVTCSDAQSKIGLASPRRDGAILGTLDHLRLDAGASVALEAYDGTPATIAILVDRGITFSVPFAAREFLLDGTFVELSTPDRVMVDDPASFRVTLDPSERFVRIASQEKSVTLTLRPADIGGQLLNARASVPINHLQLDAEDASGKPVSSLVKEAVLSFPDYPAIEAKKVPVDVAVTLRSLEDARLTGFSLRQQPTGIDIRVEGTVSGSRFGSQSPASEPRLALFDVVRFGPRIQLILLVGAWALPTVWTAWERWKK